MQERYNQKIHFMYGVSKKTTEAVMYHSSRLELMVNVRSVSKPRHLFIGIHFTIIILSSTSTLKH